MLAARWFDLFGNGKIGNGKWGCTAIQTQILPKIIKNLLTKNIFIRIVMKDCKNCSTKLTIIEHIENIYTKSLLR